MCRLMTILLAVALLGGLALAQVEIGAQKQLFIDEQLIDKSENITLTVNQPRKDAQPVMVGQGEELNWALYNQILEDGGVYKMWYQARRGGNMWIGYATSKDGLTWDKPNLGLVEIEGSKDNNIVFPFKSAAPFQIEGGCVFIDSNPACPPQEKYKMIVRWRPSEAEHHGTWVLVSADGIHFKPIADKPSFRDSDTGNVGFWDERIGKYVIYVRMWLPGILAPRVVCRCETGDLRDFGKEEIVIQRDRLDPKDVEFYTNAAIKYEGVYLAFPSMLHTPENFKELDAKKINYGRMDVQLATSRDGVKWNRPDRRPFVSLGLAGAWDSEIIYLYTGLIEKPDELWFYYWGRNYTHHVSNRQVNGPMTCHVNRLVLRRDRFISADAPFAGGRLTTKPLRFEGSKLVLNIETSVAGEARVELLDQAGAPIPSFTLADCDPIKDNNVRKVVSWKGNADLSKLAGQPMRIRFDARDAKWYAFQFVK